ncbi:MAG: valine--tRNA ligase [Planctomycetes bacterium]|nr:valine--tRNA ligase [Planctomycetota bacterium]
MTNELPTRYSPKDIEEKWYKFWEENGLFHSEPDPARPMYSIVIPPPNVTGALHMGHALNNTIQDILIRWKRMQGFNALWMPGTDHAGIATQNVVEKELAKKKLTRHDLGREKFVEEVWTWKDVYHARITSQLKKLGSSCDWARERFTMDEGLSAAVREAFVTLYEKGLIYKGKYIINWCPRCHTALSDDELEYEDHEGHLWHIRYPFKDEPHLHVTVATTRPETMLGDTAVAVNPKDERFKDLIGKALILPVVGREIPIIPDDFVDPEFGTGAVKVTPAHDPNDFEIGLRHDLEQVIVMNEDGTMNENAGDYNGQDRYECREALVQELKLKKLIHAIEPYTHSVAHCYRCHDVIEPYLSDQWFVKMKPLAAEAIQATKDGRVTLFPQRWTHVYMQWLENVRDWCISRQLWWGHRIPAWYCDDCGATIVPRTDPTECAECKSKNIRQDEDVLDTWFSSDLWPFSTLGWPEQTPELDCYYPTSVLVTDRGIIYLWVARMVMMGLFIMKKIPFAHVYIHGTILDEEGRKMSKSLGNGIDPIVMIEGGVDRGEEHPGYGADAVRFSLISLTVEGQDVKLSPSKFEYGRNFANKMWNAARFVLMNMDELSGDAPKAETIEDRWILSRLHTVVEQVTTSLDQYCFNDATGAIYDFAWHDFCDWYVEIVKPRLNEGGDVRTGAQHRLARVLDGILRLLHPFMPFVTEELWQALKKRAGKLEPDDVASIMLASWPEVKAAEKDAEAEETMDLLQSIVRGVRNIRSKMNVQDKAEVEAVVSAPDEATAKRLSDDAEFVCRMANLSDMEIGVDLAKPESSAVEVVGQIQVFVPLEGLIDFEAEKTRLHSRIEKVEKQLAIVNGKLSNENFVSKAPADIVQRERDRLAELEAQLDTLKKNYADLEGKRE